MARFLLYQTLADLVPHVTVDPKSQPSRLKFILVFTPYYILFYPTLI